MLHLFIRKIDKALENSRFLTEKVSNIKKEIIKPKSFFQGEQFEQFVEDFLFPEDEYVLVKRTDNFERNYKRFSESTNDPDFLFRCKKTNQEFAIEAKFRTNLNKKGELSWCREYQLKRYKVIDEHNIPVFIVVGLGGTSNKPERLFLFPVKHVKYIKLYMENAQNYEIKANKTVSISSEYLWELLRKNKYFDLNK